MVLLENQEKEKYGFRPCPENRKEIGVEFGERDAVKTNAFSLNEGKDRQFSEEVSTVQ